MVILLIILNNPIYNFIMSKFKHRDFFRYFTTGVLFFFSLLVVSVFVADIVYINADSMHEVLTSPSIRSAFVLSFVTSIIATILSLIIAIPSAYALSRYHFRGIIVLDTIVDLLIVMPVLVIGISLLVFFKVGTELTSSEFFLLQWIGMAIAACGEFFIYTKAGIILAQFFCAVSYGIRTIKAAFDEIDPRTEQVAMTLGCSRVGAFRRVTLPLAKQGILAGTVLSWVRAFGIFGAIIIVGGTVRGKTEVLPTAIYLEISIGRLEVALAISLIMMLAAAGVLIVLRVCSGKGIWGNGGVK